MRVKVGMKFRSFYADANPLWEVQCSRGRGVWECKILNEPIIINGRLIDGDYTGICKVFDSKDILHCVKLSESIKNSQTKSDDFYQLLSIGSIVHYHDGFGNYVRCEVVSDEYDGSSPSLKPIALVGNWKSHNLPYRLANGNITNNYWYDIINEGKLFHPHSSNIFECMDFFSRDNIDPKTLEPIDLTIPPMTKEESRIADCWCFVDEIKSIDGDNPEKILTEMLKRLKFWDREGLF
jgi:hypothetical protein